MEHKILQYSLSQKNRKIKNHRSMVNGVTENKLNLISTKKDVKLQIG